MSLRVNARPFAMAPVLVCMAVLAGLLLVSSLALDLFLLPHDPALGHDFSAFYAAGLALRHGYDPYNWVQLGAVEAHLRAIGAPRQAVGLNTYANPPLFAWLMAALTALPQPTAYALWLVLMAGALLAGLLLSARLYGMDQPGWLVLFMLTPVSVICLFLGQQTPLLLLGFAGALHLLRRQRPALAGLALTVGWIKPQLLFPVLLVLLGLLSWRQACRLAFGFAVASALLALASCWATGAAHFGAWWRDLLLYGHTMDTQQPAISSVAGLYLSVVGRPWSTLCAVGCLGLWVAFVALLIARARRARYAVHAEDGLKTIALALTAWLLLTPYVHAADLVLLGAALPAVLGRRLHGLADPAVRLAIGALLTAPAADLLGFRPNFVLSYSVLVPITLLLALRPWRFLRAPASASPAPLP